MNGDSSYTTHATTAAAMSAAFVAIGSWVAALYNLNPPAEVIAAAVVIITPLLSYGLKKLGIVSP